MSGALRILLVEDNPGDARLIRGMLVETRPPQPEMLCVERLSAALESLSQGAFDVVVLDLALPDAQGVEGLRRIADEFPSLPVVILTGADDEATGLLALQHGAQDYWVKGEIDSRVLAHSLRYALERKRTTEALRQSEERHRDLFEKSLGLICVHDLDGKLLTVNPATAEALGLAAQELVGRDLAEFLVPEVRPLFEEYLQRVRVEKAADGHMRILTRTGEERVWRYRNVLRSEAGRAPHVLGHAQDVTDQLELERRLREEALRDPLTGCYNRRYVTRLEEQAEPAASWSCLYFDLDRFKHYNDTYGHDAGDEILIRMARFLMRHTRASDAVVRLGGDEFLVLLAGASEEFTDAVVRRIKSGGPEGAPVSFSLGWALREPGERLAGTIRRADQRLLDVRVAERQLQRRS